jgi:hypothetical protein
LSSGPIQQGLVFIHCAVRVSKRWVSFLGLEDIAPVVRSHHAERDAYCTASSTLPRSAERGAKLSVQ